MGEALRGQTGWLSALMPPLVTKLPCHTWALHAGIYFVPSLPPIPSPNLATEHQKNQGPFKSIFNEWGKVKPHYCQLSGTILSLVSSYMWMKLSEATYHKGCGFKAFAGIRCWKSAALHWHVLGGKDISHCILLWSNVSIPQFLVLSPPPSLRGKTLTLI